MRTEATRGGGKKKDFFFFIIKLLSQISNKQVEV